MNTKMNNKKLTILQMLPSLDEGGVEQVTLDLAEYFANNCHKSLVISEGGRLVNKLEESGTKHIRWNKIAQKNPFTILGYAYKLRNLLIKNKVDILHLHSRVPAWVGYLACKTITKDKRPVIITHFHGFYSIHFLSSIMAKGDKVIAVSKAIQDYIIKEFDPPENKIELIYNGVDTKKFNRRSVSKERINKIKKDWDIENNKLPVLMLPGRITALKGHDVFINSLAEIHDINFIAIIVGSFHSSTLKKKIKEQIYQHHLEDRVKFVGHCSDMPAAMLIADIVFSTTTSQPEAFGKIAVEAMSMGKLVIASKHGGSLETIIDEENGLFFKPGDHKDLARKIVIALKNKPEKTKLGINGAIWIRQNFSIETMEKKISKLYSDLLS